MPILSGLIMCTFKVCGLIELAHSTWNVHGGSFEKTAKFWFPIFEFEFLKELPV